MTGYKLDDWDSISDRDKEFFSATTSMLDLRLSHHPIRERTSVFFLSLSALTQIIQHFSERKRMKEKIER
jgi:hypothetical protein